MATIEELERREAEMWAAEATALRNLAAHLREAVIDMPVESRLARSFARYARNFDYAATRRSVAGADNEFHDLNVATREGAPEHPIEAARKLLVAAAETEEELWSAALRRVAAALPDRGSL